MLPIWTVDAFTTSPFSGNPAAVCILSKYDDDVCLEIAKEMNLSETAFLVPIYDDTNANKNELIKSSITNKWHLRWWTPSVEVAFCGHATLASTHLLYSKGFVDIHKPIEFQTKSSGIFIASKPKSDKNEYLMNFPALMNTPFTGDQNVICKALNINNSSASIMNIVNSGEDLLVEMNDTNSVKQMSPNFAMIVENSKLGEYRCIIVTAKDSSNNSMYDFQSRVFCPACGVHEDPVTGSAHSGLGVYWSTKLNKCGEWLDAYQASERGGIVKVKYDKVNQRIMIIGSAVTIMNASMMIRSKL